MIKSKIMQTAKLFIDGSWRESQQSFTSVSPSDGKPFATVFTANESEIEEAVRAAKAAFPVWSSLDLTKRSQLVERAADILGGAEGNDQLPTQLKALISGEMGKLPAEADIEVVESADMVRYLAQSAKTQLQPEQLALNSTLWPTKRSYVMPSPIGVVAVIKPWNYPLEVPLWSITAALVSGNTVVFKPSEHSSKIGNSIAELLQKAGIPKGVFNVINGDHIVGRQLTSHKDISLISFTGGRAAGFEIASRCAQSLKRCILELSGNDAAIVCGDANLELAANGILWGALCNAGQVCTGVKRVLVVEDVYNDFLALIKSKFPTIRLGVDVGPIVSESQLLTIERQVNETISQGATLIFGGKRSKRPGFYFEPTLLTNVTPTTTIFKQECFGPVLPITKVSDEQEAIQLNNVLDYGLGASVWTKDEAKATRIANQLEVGMVWHNDVNVAFPEAPWGGIKYSGHGVDLSKWSLEEYVYRKHVCIENSKDTTRFWWFPYKGT